MLGTGRIEISEVPARARVNHGRWIADCPRQGCANAEALEPKQMDYACSNCMLVAKVEWPRNPDGISEALGRRPIPQNQNWYPKGHPEAVALGIAHGETVKQLLAENAEHGVK